MSSGRAVASMCRQRMIPSGSIRKCPAIWLACAAMICWSISVASNPSFLFKVSSAAKGCWGSGSSPVGFIRAARICSIVKVSGHEVADPSASTVTCGTRNARWVAASGSAVRSTRAGRYLK